MIILFTQNTNFYIHIAHNINKYYKNCIILTKYNEKYFTNAQIIIPIGIDKQKELNQYTKYANKFLISNSSIYDVLDDKINFYDFIKKNEILKNSPIKLINTYSTNNIDNNIKDHIYFKKDVNKKFIIKHRNGQGSLKNEIVSGDITKIIKKYSPDYQIQDLLSVHKIDCVSCLCKDGNILKSLNYQVLQFISKDLYKTDHTLFLKQTKLIYLEVISKIVKRLNYNGLVEFEFLIDKNKNIYIIESNPRISGTIFALLGRKHPYIDTLINSYCNLITHDGFNVTNYNNIYKLIYHKEKIPKYELCDCGVIKFINKNGN